MNAEVLNIIIIFSYYWQCLENEELQAKISNLEQQLVALKGEKSSPSSGQCVPDEYIDELRKRIQIQVIDNSETSPSMCN